MEKQIIEYENQQIAMNQKHRAVFTRLSDSYRDAENIINSVKKKQLELSSVRKKLWIAIVVMAVLVVVSVAVKTYM